ncbi:MAG: nucleoside deaminase [Clostridia bacterium]|nr:nucleoside deaminase [Clostridia bacterium]
MRFSDADKKYMALALSQAQAALREGEIPVGCVIADKNGEVIAEACNSVEASGDITRHAEIAAISAAGRHALAGATLYVTLEPCPMCAGAIALSGIKRVVYAAADKKYGCCGSVYRLTEDPAFDTFCPADGGLMKEESERLLSECFSAMRSKKG